MVASNRAQYSQLAVNSYDRSPGVIVECAPLG